MAAKEARHVGAISETGEREGDSSGPQHHRQAGSRRARCSAALPASSSSSSGRASLCVCAIAIPRLHWPTRAMESLLCHSAPAPASLGSPSSAAPAPPCRPTSLLCPAPARLPLRLRRSSPSSVRSPCPSSFILLFLPCPPLPKRGFLCGGCLVRPALPASVSRALALVSIVVLFRGIL